MEKTLMVGDKEVRFRTSAAIPRIYRDNFGGDIFLELKKVRDGYKKSKKQELPMEVLGIVENLAYCMAKHADKTIPDDITDWLAEFDNFDVYKIANEIMLLWNQETATKSVPKR